ncbi:MAG: DUF58 domain-containing protein [Candidatus Nezhaarchaeales archaeon]
MRLKLGLTSRGYKLLIFFIVIVLLSLALKDIVLAITSIAILSMLILDVARLLNRSKKFKSKVTPSNVDLRVKVGDHRIVPIVINDRIDDIEPKWGVEWIKVSKTSYDRSTLIELQIEPKITGKYHLKDLNVKLNSGFGLITLTKNLNFNLSLIVYPKVLPWILEAIAYLYGVGGLHGEVASKISGPGFEYYGSREFSLSDNPKFIDWKATARTLSLMVKEFLWERAGLNVVLYNDESMGPITRDEQLSLLLSTLLALALSGEPIGGFILKSGGTILYSSFSLSPHEALKIALAHALESHPTIRPLLYDILDPKPARSIMRILEKLRAEGLEKIIRFKLKTEVAPLSDMVKSRMGVGGRILYIGTMLCDAKFLIETAYTALTIGSEILVLTPSKPWLDSPPEEIDKVRLSHDKLINTLNKLNVKIIFHEGL